MTMTQSRSSSRTQHGSQIDTQVEALSPKDIKFITLKSGKELSVQNVEYVLFGVAESNSPIHLQNAFPTLRYVDSASGRMTWSPLDQIVAFSDGTKG